MESASLVGHPDWEPCWISGYFHGTLQCARPGCREWVIASGEMRHDIIGDELEYWDGNSWDYWLRLHYTVPALPIVSSVPDGCPSVVESRILEASRVLWADPSAAANRLRLAIEDVLTARKIKRFTINKNGKRKTLALHNRVDILRDTNREVGDTLEAVKWIGNQGSHEDSLTTTDVLDGAALLEYALKLLYDKGGTGIARNVRRINQRQRIGN